MHTLARTFVVGASLALTFGPLAARAAAPPPAGGTVYLAGGLSDEALVTLGSAVGGRGLLLLDSAGATAPLKAFLAAYRPSSVVPVGTFPDGLRRLGVDAEPLAWGDRPPAGLWQKLFPKAAAVVVCPPEPRGRLLLAACLAGAARAPLWVTRGGAEEAPQLRAWLKRWRTREVYLVGEVHALAKELPGAKPVRVTSEYALLTAYHRALGGPIETAVVCNPADTAPGMRGTSALAPWVALHKRASLLLTNKAGSDAAAVVSRAATRPSLRHLDSLLLLADLKAIPTEKRPNPIPADKDKVIEMEPLTPKVGGEPFSYAVGRLFHADRALVPLLLARQRLLARAAGPRRALVASNPGGGLPLLETFSRTTALELDNAGYRVTGVFAHDLTGPKLRKLLPKHDVFLWEGHHNTLIKDWGFASWDEPLPPMFVFLQSCLALEESKVQPLLTRGAVGVVGSSTRTYSGSGGACSLAFFDGLVHDGQSAGGALRQAKNFLLAYAQLKEQRLGPTAKRGANQRAAWAFTLWGDPTLRLPRPEPPAGAKPAVRHRVVGTTVVLTVPSAPLGAVSTGRYTARQPANARLAGLVRKAEGPGGRSLVPLVFAEVPLPRARAGQAPRLRTRLPATHWVFLWDERRRTGYLLATPRERDGRELRFKVEWAPAEIAGRAPAPAAAGR